MKHEPVLESEFTVCRKTRHGWLAYNKNDKTIGLSLTEYGEWAEFELSLGLLPLLREGDLVVDVGAHIGTHTIAFAKAVGRTGHVLAFEPQLWANYYLAANIALNSLDNVTAVRVALGSGGNHAVKVAQLDQRAQQNFGALALGGEGDEVPERNLDEYNLPGCRLIKIDVEGKEVDVLWGAQETIKKFRPIIFAEANKDPGKIISTLLHFGYQLFWHSTPFWWDGNFYGNQNELNKGGGDVSVLAVPEHVHVGGLPPVTGPDDTWDAARQRWLDSLTT